MRSPFIHSRRMSRHRHHNKQQITNLPLGVRDFGPRLLVCTEPGLVLGVFRPSLGSFRLVIVRQRRMSWNARRATRNRRIIRCRSRRGHRGDLRARNNMTLSPRLETLQHLNMCADRVRSIAPPHRIASSQLGLQLSANTGTPSQCARRVSHCSATPTAHSASHAMRA